MARDAAVGIGVAAAIFALSYADGGFAPTTRSYAGIAAWWLLGAGAAIGIAGARAGINRLALAAVGLLAAFAVWILISVNWATDAERAFAQFNQVSLYVAVLAIAIVLARLVPASWVVGGVALALSAIATVALVSRCFPSTFGLQPGRSLLPALASRLSFPLGYWNGLGIEVALAYPLLLAIMTSRRSRVASALAAFPLPILAADMYLTSSRGAFVAAAVGVIAYVVLTPRRWAAAAALVVAGTAGAVAVAVLVHKTGPRQRSDGHRARRAPGPPRGAPHRRRLRRDCARVARACRARKAPAHAAAHRRGGSRDRGRRPRSWSQSSRVTRWRSSISSRTLRASPARAFTRRNHLSDSSGSGRWQFWGAAVSEFQAHPLNGGGAGSWEAWWLQHGSLPLPSEFAHSLYLEALAELGIIGLLLIGGAVLVAAVGAVRSALALQSGEIAAAAACGIAFFAAAAYDWVWQLAGIAVVGVGMLGFALGALPAQRASAWGRFGALRPTLALVAVAAIIPQYVVLAAGSHLRNSQAAFRARDGPRARSEALAAKAIEPWAASPYLQLGFVAEAEGRYAEAARWGREAIQHSRRDWNVWTNAAIFETMNGNIRAARRDLAEARRLNPHSIILARPGGGG